MPHIREILEPFVRRDPKLVVELDPAGQTVVRMQGRLSAPVDLTMLKQRPKEAARAVIAGSRALLGDIDERTSLADGRVTVDDRGMTHVVLDQIHGEAKVIGARVSVHFQPDGALHLLSSSLVKAIDAPTTPRITAAEARKIATAHAGGGAVVVESMPPALVVASASYLHIARSQSTFHLCWQVEVDQPRATKPAAWTYFIDAVTGTALCRFSSLIAGTGVGVYSAYGPLPTEASGADFVALDDQTSASWATHPHVETKDWNGAQLARDDNDNWGETETTEQHERCEVDIHRYLGYVLNYFHSTHQHDSWNGAGANTVAYAHYSDPDNAYWHSSSQTIRVGGGTQEGGGGSYGPFSSLDVLFHEFTHGVNYHFQVVQTYWGETGALNEAIADSFAAFGTSSYPADDSRPWAIMDRVVLTVNPRNLADPSRDGSGTVRYDATNNTTKFNSVIQGYYPDHYSIRYLGTSDYAGVHCNAPIIGHAIYLMTVGGTHRLSGVSVAGIGQAPVEQMLFHTIATPGLLDNTSDFAEFRRAMLSACQTLFPDNLDYLVTVKAAFKAVGVGPDLYIRDLVSDTGTEPATSLSCASPDIISRTAPADAALLAQIASLNNASLCQNIEKGQDNYVYFRILNGGSTSGGGTFKLYLSPVSTFPNPASWNFVGSFVVPPIAAGGFWTPSTATDCIVVPASLTNTLGTIHCCFIGVMESSDDPAPDRMQIGSIGEFYDYIRKSNNYAWRNCNIVDAVADPVAPVLVHAAFELQGFGPRPIPTDIEIDTTNLPHDAAIDVLLPAAQARYLKAAEVRRRVALPGRPAIGTVPKPIQADQQAVVPQAVADLAVPTEQLMFARHMLEKLDIAKMRALRVTGSKITRVSGLRLNGTEKMTVNFVLKLPPVRNSRDHFLAFRQTWRGEAIGQVTYEIRVRPPR